MDNVKALEILKHNLEISMCSRKLMLGDNVPPELREETQAEKLAIEALEKRIAVPVIVQRRENRLAKFYCPTCKKQQHNSYKNRRVGCFCERCGQRLTFPEVAV